MNANNDELFIRAGADSLSQLIADRLKDRQEKLDRMAEWEKQQAGLEQLQAGQEQPTGSQTSVSKLKKFRPLYWLPAVAACIVAALLLWPAHDLSLIDGMGIDAPTISTYRGSSAEADLILDLIGQKRYDEALTRAQEALRKSNLTIAETENLPEAWGSDEEMAYEDRLLRIENNDLRWTCIYLLLQTNQTRKARKELKLYLRYPEYCEHEQEARGLLKKIKD